MEEKIEVKYETNSSVDLKFHIGSRLYEINILRDTDGSVRQVKIARVREAPKTTLLEGDEFKILRYLREEGELRGAI